MSSQQLRFGQYLLRSDQLSLTDGLGNRLQLRPKEFQLLQFFANNPNKVINKTFLLEMIWNYNLYSPTNTLEVHLSNLRKKLAHLGQTIIETVHGSGYRLVLLSKEAKSTD